MDSTAFSNEHSISPMGDAVPSMQHVLLTHTFIWAVYRKLTALHKQNNITQFTCMNQKHTYCL